MEDKRVAISYVMIGNQSACTLICSYLLIFRQLTKSCLCTTSCQCSVHVLINHSSTDNAYICTCKYEDVLLVIIATELLKPLAPTVQKKLCLAKPICEIFCTRSKSELCSGHWLWKILWTANQERPYTTTKKFMKLTQRIKTNARFLVSHYACEDHLCNCYWKTVNI